MEGLNLKILSCALKNFASYKELEFNFENQGLTLIQGANGSGKSTLCDAVPWILFGRTSKNGSVDEILSWPGDQVTSGTAYFEGGLEITRIRGSKAKDNDLYFLYENDTGTVSARRGKDLQDTQKLINNLLGIDSNLYLAGAYFHEFSQTAQFFNTTAKNRRLICEQIVDLSLAQNLQVNASVVKKTTSKVIDRINSDVNGINTTINVLTRMQTAESNKHHQWEVEHEKTIDYTIKAYEKFEANRKKIISKKCNSCGTMLEHPREVIDNSDNPYISRLEELKNEVNPHTSGVKDFSNEIQEKNIELLKLNSELEIHITKRRDLELLEDIINVFRGTIVRNALSYVESETNKLLTDHFDAEIRAEMSIQDSDKVEAVLTKDGNTCSYTQLSKGQRQLLKLCFGVAIMKCVSNNSGVKFNQIFFDEALDGLDENMKSKAFRLLSTLELEYDSIFVVEHSSSFKTLFNNSYSVELINGNSQICQN